MKYFFLVFISFFTVCKVQGQIFGNEWIQYDQRHYSFDVVETGIYRINYAELLASGVPVGQFTSSNIQIFGREKEIPILIEDGGDNTLNPGDYILFFAERNDGWLDSMLYENGGVGNPKYSLYNDTIQYFFTWNNSTTNKRVVKEVDQNFQSFSPSEYITVEKSTYFNEKYNEGERSSQASSSLFKQGEGWGNNAVNGVSGYTWNFNNFSLPNVFQGADAPAIRYRSVIYGASNATSSNNAGNHHNIQSIGSSNYILVDTVFNGYKSVLTDVLFPTSIVTPGALNFKIKIAGDLNVSTDYQSVNYFEFTYPQKTIFSGENTSLFTVQNATTQNKIRLDLVGLGCSAPIMFSLGQDQRWISLAFTNDTIKALIPNDLLNEDQKIFISDQSEIIEIASFKEVGNAGFFTNYSNAVNIEEALLFVYPQKLENKALEYAAYRSSVAGGAYNVIEAKVEELYQQFGGGIPKHINGIRRFAHFIHTNSNSKPVGLFLVGKGIREANITSVTNLGPGSRTNLAAYQNNLIPSFGQPSCDQCITSNLPETGLLTPLIPTGRISVLTEDELGIYLSKVIEYEAEQNQNTVYSTQTKDWQKHILHFSGGGYLAEQQQFQGYLNQMASIAEGNFFAGTVELVAKDSQDPISPTELEEIKQRISEGVSVMNFFGHFSSTESGFDINLDQPQYWDNQGRYPILIANSCYNGNIFHNAPSNSQSFTLAPNAGVIAYIGSINYGFTSSLNAYSNNFYKQFSLYNYGGTIGSHIRNVMDSVLNQNIGLITESTFSQMTLNGDPMLKVNYHNKPEIELTESRVTFGPQNITLATDSIEISIKIRNLGKSVTDTIGVEIVRDFPGSSSDSIYNFPLHGLNYEHIENVKIPFQPTIGIGSNKFRVSVDIPSLVAEQYDEENNNKIVRNFFIDIDGIEPILPSKFAVVPKDTVRLYASTINPLAELNTYRFEVDTNIQFNSPFLKHTELTGFGGVKSVGYNEWFNTSNASDSLRLEDSVVYYWRVKVAETNQPWKYSSFQYIPNKEGWGQADYDQFTSNSFLGVELSSVNELREFTPIEAQLSCITLSSTSSPDIYSNAYSLNGVQQDYGVCTMVPKFHVAIIDKSTLIPWKTRYTYEDGTVVNPENDFGNWNDNGACNPRENAFFVFHQNNLAEIDAFQNLVENVVPDGNYILIYTPFTTRYDWWNLYDPGLYSTFSNLGSDSIFTGCNRPNRPFIFLTRKGDPSFVVEKFSQANETISIDTLLAGLELIGNETSPLIGPVESWTSLYWNHNPLENPITDTTRFLIDVYNNYQAYQYTIDTILLSGDSIVDLNTLIDANLYPYLKLKASYKDDINQTPSQLKNWHILYQSLPEAAIDANDGMFGLQINDTLQEGQEGSFSIGVRNISEKDMDSILVNYYILDEAQQKHFIDYPRQDSLRSAELLQDTISFSTKDIVGLNYLCMEVNPYIDLSQTVLDQPEFTHINNLLQLPFFVEAEELNPILDVTFDGRRIMNEDVVSPYSEILITLKDENPFLVMNEDSDTSKFGIYVTNPSGIQSRIPFVDDLGNNVMFWTPANASNLKFKIDYPANFTEDGMYELYVQGADKSGNLSGDLEYRVRFEVIHESSITRMLNYPNPFSTSTRFVFNLTGSMVPDDIQIQILNISGKVVRQIDEIELGQIHIGRNITDFAWDGKDDFGNQLANGVYLYRVIAKINGEDIKKLDSGADQYFKQDFGKMYLIR